MACPTSEPAGVTYENVAELEGFWAVPDGVQPIGAVVYLYGGGEGSGQPSIASPSPPP